MASTSAENRAFCCRQSRSEPSGAIAVCMPLKAGPVPKPLAALQTRKRHFPRMATLVNDEARAMAELLPTFQTFKRPLIGVGANVGLVG